MFLGHPVLYENFKNLKNKKIAMKCGNSFYLIKKLNICSIPLSESEEYDILKIIPMSLYI